MSTQAGFSYSIKKAGSLWLVIAFSEGGASLWASYPSKHMAMVTAKRLNADSSEVF